MVIDLETVAEAKSPKLPDGLEEVLKTCTQSALDDHHCFTPASDMFCIGAMLDGLSHRMVSHPSEAAVSFIEDLMAKRLTAFTAVDRLRMEWKSGSRDLMPP